LNPQFVNAYNNGSRQFLAEKNCLFNPSLPSTCSYDLPFLNAVQEPGTFVALPPCAYHGGFNTGFNIAEAVNYADCSWLTPARITSRTETIDRLSNQVSLPIEYMVCMEAKSFIEQSSSCSSSTLRSSVRSLHDVLTIIFRQARRKLNHFCQGELNRIIKLDSFQINGLPGVRGFPCFACGRPAFFYVQICQVCRDISHVGCISHLSDK